MRLLHVNNIVSPHQMPLARCLADHLGTGNYRYAATEPTITERTAMGWNCGEREPWILRVHEGVAVRQEYQEWWDEADVVLCGDRAIGLMENRLKRGKLTVYMSERWWKPPLGMARLAHPLFALMALQLRRLAASSEFHYLPIGRHAATDMKRWAAFQDRSWLWGYFTALPVPLPQPARCDAGLEILYAGRMLGWKRIDTLIQGFGVLLREGKVAQLTLIGDGPERKGLEAMVLRLGLVRSVNFRSSLPMEQVWTQMRSAHVYVLPSNGYEGWGAVVNEAMSFGCAVIASAAAGSAKTMIRHKENGLLFRPGDWQSLGRLLCSVSKDETCRIRLAQEGQRTIAECWSPAVAAERFLLLSHALLTKRPVTRFNDGPMAPA